MTSPDVTATVRAVLDDHVEAGATVVVGLSGGADSVGMTELVVRARSDLRVIAVHVRHGLRADDHRDAEIAGAHARRLALPLQVVTVAVAAGSGPEDAARRARLAALGDVAVQRLAGHVLLGHTADDQAETVLLNIARGAGLPGAAGMPQMRRLRDGVVLVRPVLGLRRAAVRAVAQGSGMVVADDPTNRDASQRRARARHDVLPRLATLTGGDSDAVDSLVRLAGHARRDTAALDDLAATWLSGAATTWGPVQVVPAAALDALDAAVATRVVRGLIAGTQVTQHPPTEEGVQAVLELRDGKTVEVAGGVAASRGGGHLAVAPRPVPALPARTASADVALPELGLVLRVGDVATPGVLPPWAPAIAARSVRTGPDAAVTVRARCRGDRIRTAAGTQLLSEAMVDAGVPRLARDLVPVVEDDHGVLWVPGVAVRTPAAGPRCLHLEPAK